MTNARAIADAARRILQVCVRIESGFTLLDVTALLDEYKKGVSDFNDQVLVALCLSQGLTLVTHDGDFKGCGVPLVTANRHLLT